VVHEQSSDANFQSSKKPITNTENITVMHQPLEDAVTNTLQSSKLIVPVNKTSVSPTQSLDVNLLSSNELIRNAEYTTVMDQSLEDTDTLHSSKQMVPDNQTSVVHEQSSDANFLSSKKPITNTENITVMHQPLEDAVTNTLHSSKLIVPVNKTSVSPTQCLDVNLLSINELIRNAEYTTVMDQSLDDTDTLPSHSSKQMVPDNQTSLAHEQTLELNLQSSIKPITNTENATVMDQLLEDTVTDILRSSRQLVHDNQLPSSQQMVSDSKTSVAHEQTLEVNFQSSNEPITNTEYNTVMDEALVDTNSVTDTLQSSIQVVPDIKSSEAYEQSLEENFQSPKVRIMNTENTTVMDQSLEDEVKDTFQISEKLASDIQTSLVHEHPIQTNLQSSKELIMNRENTTVMDHSLADTVTEILQSSKQLVPDYQTSVTREQFFGLNLQFPKQLILNTENSTVMVPLLEDNVIDTSLSSEKLVPVKQTSVNHNQSLEVNLQSSKQLIVNTQTAIFMDQSLEDNVTDALQSSKQLVPVKRTSMISEQSLVDKVTDSLQTSTSKVHKQSLWNKVSDASQSSKQLITSTCTSTDHQIPLGDNVNDDKAVSFVDLSQPGQTSRKVIIDLTIIDSKNSIDLTWGGSKTVKKSTSTEHSVVEEYRKARRNSRLFRRRSKLDKRSSESRSSVTEIQTFLKDSASKKSIEKHTSPNLFSRQKRKIISIIDDDNSATSEFEYMVRRFFLSLLLF